jgi:thiol-disulfide isomerase/thioredoxin
MPTPLQLTITLSAATLLGYGAYRILYVPDSEPLPTGSMSDVAAELDGLANTLPDFALDDLSGQSTPINSWSGRPLVVNFWATWCAPCLREIPLLKQFQTSEPNVQIVGIAVDRPDPVREFAAATDFNYPILVGQTDAMDAATAFGISVFVLPFTVFTTASGETLGVHTGELHQEHLDQLKIALDGLADGRLDLAAARQQLAGLR